MDLQPRNGTNIVTDFNERTQFVRDSADVVQFVSCRTIASVRGCSLSRCPNGLTFIGIDEATFRSRLTPAAAPHANQYLMSMRPFVN